MGCRSKLPACQNGRIQTAQARYGPHPVTISQLRNITVNERIPGSILRVIPTNSNRLLKTQANGGRENWFVDKAFRLDASRDPPRIEVHAHHRQWTPV